jgi:hypothetical protein
MSNCHRSSAAVNRTIGNFSNNDGWNVPLWLDGDYGLRYSGIENRLQNVSPMAPQLGLWLCVLTRLPTPNGRRRVG